jgi:hypothetical protein
MKKAKRHKSQNDLCGSQRLTCTQMFHLRLAGDVSP